MINKSRAFNVAFPTALAFGVLGAVIFRTPPAFGTTRYIAQTAGTFSGGTACNGQMAITPATFNGVKNSPGDVNYICGPVTATTGPILSPQGSGSSGNPIKIIWDTGARLSITHGPLINIQGLAYYLFDGGIACGPGTNCDSVEAAHPSSYAAGQAGIIEATANGTAPNYANQDDQTQAIETCNTCHDIEIRNVIIRNLYVHVAPNLGDGSGSPDTNTFVFKCAEGDSGCASGTISIHDSTFHDMGNAISIEKTNLTTVNIYNIDFYHDNWGIENSGDGTRTLNIHNNYVHDANTWDTGDDSFHHNFLHNYMNTPSDSLALNFYNNYSYGNWGSCCTTDTLIFTETDLPNNFNVFNNLDIQACDGENAPSLQIGVTNGVVANNTIVGCASQNPNVEAIQLYGTGFTLENNVIQGYGQYIVVNSGTGFTALDYNVYGVLGHSGNAAWQCGATGATSLSEWRSSCSGDSHGMQNNSLGLSSSGIPQAGSVVIGAGTNLTSLCSNLPALCSDFSGNARPATGAWAAGAFSSAVQGPNPPVGLTGVAH